MEVDSSTVTVQMHPMSPEVNRDVPFAHDNNDVDAVTNISKGALRKLCDESIELIKAKKEIQNLKKTVEKLNAEIQKEKAKFSHLSEVSISSTAYERSVVFYSFMCSDFRIQISSKFCFVLLHRSKKQL